MEDLKLFLDKKYKMKESANNAYFSDGGDYSKKEYLRRIVYDALS